jgi:hypothetical protein
VFTIKTAPFFCVCPVFPFNCPSRHSRCCHWSDVIYMIQFGGLGLEFLHGKASSIPGRTSATCRAKHLYPLWDPPRVLFIGYLEIFPGVRHPVLAGHALLVPKLRILTLRGTGIYHRQHTQVSEVMNAWSFTFTFPICLHGVVLKRWDSVFALCNMRCVAPC